MIESATESAKARKAPAWMTSGSLCLPLFSFRSRKAGPDIRVSELRPVHSGSQVQDALHCGGRCARAPVYTQSPNGLTGPSFPPMAWAGRHPPTTTTECFSGIKVVALTSSVERRHGEGNVREPRGNGLGDPATTRLRGAFRAFSSWPCVLPPRVALGTVTLRTGTGMAGSNCFTEQGKRAKVYVLLKFFIVWKQTLLLSHVSV